MLLALHLAPTVLADEPAPAEPGTGYRVESVRVRYTHYEQDGRGYQSQAGPITGPGSEQATIDQPQLEIVAKQGERLTHTLWIPLDVISAASPDAIDGVDAVSGPSRMNEAGTIHLATNYHADRNTDLGFHGSFHIEEQFRSWTLGTGYTRKLADDNATFSVSVNEVYDWFDAFDIHGNRENHLNRSSTNGNLSLTQLLSATTVANIGYGVTVQTGALGNTWNVVPLTTGGIGPEILPKERNRHAFVGRIAQWLPWDGALRASYRFYIDDWGINAHTVEADLSQHLGHSVYARVNYRLHVQKGADFFTIRGSPNDNLLRTADSDLGSFVAQTIGGAIYIDLKPRRYLRNLHLDVGAERYQRSDSLHATILSMSLGIQP